MMSDSQTVPRPVWAVTDRNDGDRENPIIDVFRSEASAVSYRNFLGYGEVEAWDNLDRLGGPDESWDWTDSSYACHVINQ